MKFPDPEKLTPELAELRAKELELSEQSRPLRAERLEVLELLRSGQANDTPDVDPAHARVAGLLGRLAPAKAKSPRERLREIDRELVDVDAALSVLANDIQAAHQRASVAARSEMEGEYRKRAAAVATALIQAHRANFALRQFVESFEDSGFSSGAWSQLFPSLLGGHADPESAVARYLRECADAGIITRADIPVELRHA